MLFFSISLLILCFTKDFISTYGSKNSSIQSKSDALMYLNRFGYNPCGNSQEMFCSLSLTSMLQEFQKRFHLKPTGLLDDPTKEQMNRPRCGNKDPPLTPPSNKKKLASMILKWTRSALTWSLRNYSPRISLSETQTIIQKAFHAWFQYIPFTIKQVCPTCPANIIIDFNQWDHGDGYPFDGPGRTLAHAFFPEDGRIHFDVDELWTTSQEDYKINFYLVAVHEIGHALGLDHIYRKDSIMYPNYQLIKEKDILPYVDRIQIQNLYGVSFTKPTTKRVLTTSTTRATTRSTKRTATTMTTTKQTARTTTRAKVLTTKPSITTPSSTQSTSCRLFIDAAFDFPDKTFHILDTGLFRRYLPDKQRWDSQAVPCQQMYSHLPSRISAGVYDFSRDEVLIFTSARVYRYKIHLNSYRISYRQDETLPIRLQSGIVGAIYYQDNVYVIKENTLQAFDVNNAGRKSNERKLKEEFPGLTGPVKAAFTRGYLHHFFTTDRLVYVWDEQSAQWETFGKPMETHWFVCRKTK